MVNNDDVNQTRWVDERLESLEVPAGFRPSSDSARARLRERQKMVSAAARRMRIAGAAAAILFGLLALPGPRALAQRVWTQLTLDRVAVVDIAREDVTDDLAGVFAMQPQPFEQTSVANADEAARIAGFRPLLPSPGVLRGPPSLSVVESITLSTNTLKTSEIEQALVAAGVTDVAVPEEWDGMRLVAQGGPAIVAEYPQLEVIQAAPFRMTAPAAFEFGRFMEVAFRVFGRDAVEARALGQRLAANPALVMHFPRRGAVREVPLHSGRGLFVGDPDGSEGICFFWNTQDRIYIIGADRLTEQQAADVANSLE